MASFGACVGGWGGSGGGHINRGSSVLSTSNEDSRPVWTSSFIHSLAPAQFGVGAGGVAGVAPPLGTGPELGGKRGMRQNNIALFPFLNDTFQKFEGWSRTLRAIHFFFLEQTKKQTKGTRFPPTRRPASIPGILSCSSPNGGTQVYKYKAQPRGSSLACSAGRIFGLVTS